MGGCFDESNVDSLRKVYIEPTSRCNLSCKTCIRNSWHEPMGDMKLQTFDKLISDLSQFSSIEKVMFGGFGEPTYHKDIAYMIQKVKSIGLNAELTTNGTLLHDALIDVLYKSRLDKIWISIDSFDEYDFESVRNGACYNDVFYSLDRLHQKNKSSIHKIETGLAFVLMKDNVENLSLLSKKGKELGVTDIIVTNVLPYTRELVDQFLAEFSVSVYQSSHYSSPSINLPLMDINKYTEMPLMKLMKSSTNIQLMGNKVGVDSSQCRFIKEGITFIRWDGEISPCMGLLHSSITYSHLKTFYDKRSVTEYSLGNVQAKSLNEIWNSDEYSKFRRKVEGFEFSPCSACASCYMHEENKEDCFGNTFPTCGGCLWAQGVIQCP